MNPADRLISQYEGIVHNQAVTHERLQLLIGLLITAVLLGLAMLILQVWVLNVKMVTRRELGDMRDLLVLVKDWVYSAKSNVKDAQMTLQDVKQATATITHPTREEAQIKKAVDELPEKTSELTADKVVERLGGSDAIKRLLIPPLLAVLTVTGASFAGGKVTAADELRRVNAAAAVELAAGEPGTR